MAEAFAQEGAAVAAAARTEAQVDARLPGWIHDVVAGIEKEAGRAIAVRCGVSREGDRIRLVEIVRGAFGPVDVLVNDAAVTVPGRMGAAPSPTEARTGLASVMDLPIRGPSRSGSFPAFT